MTEVNTNQHFILTIHQFALSFHIVSVIFVTSTCFLSLSNCETVLAANSVNLNDLIS